MQTSGTRAPTLIGLTGGIGSGKSTVSALLADLGAAVIDADALSRATTAAGGAALPAIAETFGAHLIGADGALDRVAMRAVVFADATARARLEAIVHPLVAAESARLADAARAEGRTLLVFDVPLLAESAAAWRARVDQIWVVDCDRETQIARVMARSALARDEVERILAAQASREERLALADVVLANGAGVTLQALAEQVRRAVRGLAL